MSGAIFLLKTQFTHQRGPTTVKTGKDENDNTIFFVQPNKPAKLLTKLALSDLVVLIAALAIGILGVMGMTHVMNMPSEMIYAFAGAGLVGIPYAILLIKNTSKMGLDKGLVRYLRTIPTTINWACSKDPQE